MKKTILILLICSMLAFPVNAENKTEEADEAVRLPIVMYHHMSPKARLWGEYVISPEQFESDLEYLKTHGYTPISTRELFAWYDGEGALPEKPVMITFDDGYESTFVYAAPLLEQYGMPSVVNLIGAVAQQYTDTPDHMLDYSHMSWEEAVQADAGGLMEIQCHTWDMHTLGARMGCKPKSGESDESYFSALSEDLGRFIEAYERHMGHTCTVLAVPFGMYTNRTLEYACQLGFRAIMTCSEQVNLLTGDESELLRLGRYNRPSGITSEAFFSKWE